MREISCSLVYEADSVPASFINSALGLAMRSRCRTSPTEIQWLATNLRVGDHSRRRVMNN